MVVGFFMSAFVAAPRPGGGRAGHPEAPVIPRRRASRGAAFPTASWSKRPEPAVAAGGVRLPERLEPTALCDHGSDQLPLTLRVAVLCTVPPLRRRGPLDPCPGIHLPLRCAQGAHGSPVDSGGEGQRSDAGHAGVAVRSLFGPVEASAAGAGQPAWRGLP